ncbi:hypothetical protein QCA50_007747 [Cerrena zonata]|uniref:Uncharacterized protein n=1 Tax=Cerrena zonata TaxID=2478898 RepID=A0AAW0GHZ3_9APHY
MVRTRQTTRSTTTSTNPSSVNSPVFSVETSVKNTPATTPDPDELKTTRVTRATRSKAAPKGKKRARETDSEGEHSKESAPLNKKRALSREVYVDIPSATTKSAPKAPAAKKGKGKAFVPTIPTSDPLEEEIVEDDGELEFDEDAELEDPESDDSGSEFEDPGSEVIPDSEEEFDLALARAKLRSGVEQAGIDDDELMIDAAIQESLTTAREGRDIAAGNTDANAGSSRLKGARNKAAALRASAAEHRLKHTDAQESDFEDESEAQLSSEEDEPLADRKGKGKAKTKTKTKKSAKVQDTSKPKMMTLKERRRLQREARNAHKKEETELRRKLGRKLTIAEKTTVALHKHHPELRDVWGDVERQLPIPVPQIADPPAGLKVTLLPFQRESLFWMKNQEKSIWHGGLLADEMGMGKTIQMIALLCSDKGAKPNLVVAPTVAVMQWRNEIEAHSTGMDVLVWHGASRESNIKELKKYDVILTTYAVLESSFRKQQSGFKRKGMIVKEKSIPHQIKWNRIILDEAHNIKERATNTAKACFELQANVRWCLSGTPLQNRVGELYSMIRFLGGDPFSFYFCKQCDCKSLHWKFSDKRSCDDCGHSPMKHTCFWNNEILTPIQKNGMVGPGATAFKKLKILLDRMMLRRTKIQRADDLGLPPRTVIIRRDYFSPEEEELYKSLFSDAKRQFSTYLDSGTLLNNYSNIFSLLTRMRQMACHPDLVLRSKTNAGSFLPDDAGEATVCRLCNDIAEDAIQSRCRHIFDRECIRQYLDTYSNGIPACPVCHVPLTIDLEAPALELEENAKVRQGILGRLDLNKWRSSSKIEALIEELSSLRRQDASTKSIVFSQFVNFLDLIAYRLQRAGFSVCRLEGTMSPQARDATIKHFMNNVHVSVFLVSLKAGGVALNLTEASRVYLMDSWWNPAVEYQAMDRIHRLGQHRPVQAIKLVIEDSIESRIVQLQEKKAAMVDATLSTDDSAMGRLTPEDLGFLFRM